MPMIAAEQAQAFADDPAAYFDFDANKMGSIDRSEMREAMTFLANLNQ